MKYMCIVEVNPLYTLLGGDMECIWNRHIKMLLRLPCVRCLASCIKNATEKKYLCYKYSYCLFRKKYKFSQAFQCIETDCLDQRTKLTINLFAFAQIIDVSEQCLYTV